MATLWLWRLHQRTVSNISQTYGSDEEVCRMIWDLFGFNCARGELSGRNKWGNETWNLIMQDIQEDIHKTSIQNKTRPQSLALNRHGQDKNVESANTSWKLEIAEAFKEMQLAMVKTNEESATLRQKEKLEADKAKELLKKRQRQRTRETELGLETGSVTTPEASQEVMVTQQPRDNMKLTTEETLAKEVLQR
jgi:hypothetical protein